MVLKCLAIRPGGSQLIMKKVAITGAAGNIGRKLRRAFENRFDLVLLDRRTEGDDEIVCADLSEYDDRWTACFSGTSTVIHLAANPDQDAPWGELFADNIDSVLNVCHACVDKHVARLIFASSCHTMKGYFGEDLCTITSELKPSPVSAYGVSKVIGERICRSFSKRHPLSVICLRIGWVPHGDRKPETKPRTWLGSLWLSNNDLAQIFEKSILVRDVDFMVLYAMSNNEGMVWDLQTTIETLDYHPLDGIGPG